MYYRNYGQREALDIETMLGTTAEPIVGTLATDLSEGVVVMVVMLAVVVFVLVFVVVVVVADGSTRNSNKTGSNTNKNKWW